MAIFQRLHTVITKVVVKMSQFYLLKVLFLTLSLGCDYSFSKHSNQSSEAQLICILNRSLSEFEQRTIIDLIESPLW